MCGTKPMVTETTIKTFDGNRKFNLQAIANWMASHTSTSLSANCNKNVRLLRGYAEQLRIIAGEWQELSDRAEKFSDIKEALEEAQSHIEQILGDLD